MPTVFAHEPTGQPSLVERMNRVKHEIGIDSQLPLKKSIKAANEALGLPCGGSLVEQVEVLCTAMWGEAAPEASGLAMTLSQMPKDARPAPQMMQGIAAPGPPIASWDSYATSGAAFCFCRALPNRWKCFGSRRWGKATPPSDRRAVGTSTTVATACSCTSSTMASARS